MNNAFATSIMAMLVYAMLLIVCSPLFLWLLSEDSGSEVVVVMLILIMPSAAFAVLADWIMTKFAKFLIKERRH